MIFARTWRPRLAATERLIDGSMDVSIVILLGLLLSAAPVQAGGTVGTSGFGGVRVGTAGGVAGSRSGFPASTSVINHGGTGFSIYSQQGVTRVIGQPKVSRKILLTGGGSVRATGDSNGGVYLFGAGGNHRLLGNSRLFAPDGP